MNGMRKRIRMEQLRKKVKSGFTLIELLLVLVILAALAAIVVPKFTRRSEQARITAAHTSRLPLMPLRLIPADTRQQVRDWEH